MCSSCCRKDHLAKLSPESSERGGMETIGVPSGYNVWTLVKHKHALKLPSMQLG